VKPTDSDRTLIGKICVDGGARCICGTADRSKYDRLVELGWLTSTVFNLTDRGTGNVIVSLTDVLYLVTAAGQNAATQTPKT